MPPGTEPTRQFCSRTLACAHVAFAAFGRGGDRLRALLACLLVITGLALLTAPARAQNGPPLTPDQQGELRYHLDNLRNNTNNPDNRRRAATFLLRMRIAQAYTALDEGLRSSDTGLIRAVATALAEEPTPPAALMDGAIHAFTHTTDEAVTAPLGRVLGRYGVPGVEVIAAIALDAERPIAARLGAVRALREFQAPETVRQSVDALIQLIDPSREEPAEIMEHAYTGLDLLTSMSQHGRNAQAWTRWWENTREGPVESWLPREMQRLTAELAQLQQERNTLRQTLDAHRARLEALLGDFYLKLGEESEEARRAQLAQWLNDPLHIVRRVAMDRVDRLVRNNEGTSPEIQAALIERLGDSQADIRRDAAGLLDRDRVSGTGAAIALALASGEREPSVIQAYLDVLQRRPHVDALPTVITLLSDATHGDRAAAVASAILARNELTDETRAALHTAAKDVAARRVSPAVVTLLGAFRDPQDLDAIQAHLSHSSAPIRAAAADALIAHPPARDAILAAAGDATIFPRAARILSDGDATLDTLQALLGLAVPNEELRSVWLAEMTRLAGRLAPTDILAASQLVSELNEERLSASQKLSLREQILARAVTIPPDTFPGEQRQATLIALAELRLSNNRAEAALEALGQLNGEENNGAASAIRLDAMLRLGRFADAARLSNEPAAWVEVLDRVAEIDVEHARRLHMEIMERFPELASELRARLDAIAGRIPGLLPPPDDDAASDDDTAVREVTPRLE